MRKIFRAAQIWIRRKIKILTREKIRVQMAPRFWCRLEWVLIWKWLTKSPCIWYQTSRYWRFAEQKTILCLARNRKIKREKENTVLRRVVEADK